jgi:cell division protease FtsH
LTRKPAKVQRQRKAAATKQVTRRVAKTSKPHKAARAVVAATVVASPAELPPDVEQGPVLAEAPPEKPAAKKKSRPSARCALVASAFRQATTGAVRKQLKLPGRVAVALLVPGAEWIEPIRTMFISRFGARWETIATDAWNDTPAHKAARNIEVAMHLARGRAVIGFAVHLDALPSTLVRAGDLTIRIKAPDGAVIARAIRLFTGGRPPAGIDDKIAIGLEFHDLLAAFRKRSSPAEIVERLHKARTVLRGTDPEERLPALEDAVEYGAAREYGLTLARDIADYRAGHDWKQIDRAGHDWKQVDRAVVLHSGPGFGKNFFCRILARACDAELLVFSIADLFADSAGFLDSVIKKSRDFFERAEAIAKARGICILMLDECDALPNRVTMSDRTSREWWTVLVTNFLISVEQAGPGIVMIGCTNNLAGVDAALMRPGRLERSIELVRPDHAGVLNVLRYHLHTSLTGADLTDVGHLLAGSTPADIMMVVRGARRIARYAGRELELDDLMESIAPAEEIAPAALLRISYHEAAHAVGSLAVPAGILQRCIVGAGPGSAGQTIIKGETADLPTRDAIERRAVVTLCGRAAEALLVGDVGLGSGGDSDSDLAVVTQFVTSLHASTGLAGSLVYLVSHEEALEAVRTDLKMRARVERHMRRLQKRADEIVRKHRDAIVAVAEQLRIRRHLTGDEIRRIFEETAPAVATARSTTRHRQQERT